MLVDRLDRASNGLLHIFDREVAEDLLESRTGVCRIEGNLVDWGVLEKPLNTVEEVLSISLTNAVW